MVDKINSKEDAQRVIHDKITEFANELEKIKENFGDQSANLLKRLKDGTLDPEQKDKLMQQLKSAITTATSNKLYTYTIFIFCCVLILSIFVYVAYYKLYKPLADKERKQQEKKQKKAKKQGDKKKTN